MAIDLNDKPWYVALIVGLVLGVTILFLMNMYFYKNQKADITDLEQKIYKLEREIEKGRQAKADLPRLEDDIREHELELDRLTRILPTRRETPALIKRLKQISELGYFKLIRFQPAAFVDKDYYFEWPIDVELDGTYHELGLFFDRLSRFSRIINVDELRVSPVRSSTETSYTIHANFTQKTFIYKETKGN